MQDWRHHQTLGPNGAFAEFLGNDDEPVFLESMAIWFFKLGDRQ
jgi:hypothetical protein